jgi:hypothetical protein
MAIRSAAFAIGVAILLTATRVEGHHHIGCVYETAAPQAVTGRITEIVWKFPHVHIRIDAVNAPPGRQFDIAVHSSPGGVAWDIETVNPQGLQRVGIERQTLKVGDALITSAWIAKDGSARAFTHSMVLPDGNIVSFPIAELTCPF